MDTKQAITEKQGLVDDMELQLMSSAPESVPCVVQVRDELVSLYDEVRYFYINVFRLCSLIPVC